MFPQNIAAGEFISTWKSLFPQFRAQVSEVMIDFVLNTLTAEIYIWKFSQLCPI